MHTAEGNLTNTYHSPFKLRIILFQRLHRKTRCQSFHRSWKSNFLDFKDRSEPCNMSPYQGNRSHIAQCIYDRLLLPSSSHDLRACLWLFPTWYKPGIYVILRKSCWCFRHYRTLYYPMHFLVNNSLSVLFIASLVLEATKCSSNTIDYFRFIVLISKITLLSDKCFPIFLRYYISLLCKIW